MKNEIDLRSLLMGHLECDTHDIRPFNIFSNKDVNIVERPLDTFREWNREEQTNYIESIFLHCSLQPIIRFVNENHTIIVDGWNRYKTIINFCSNKLVLQERGLKQLKFLAGKTFENLENDEKTYFKKCDPIRFFDYHYENSMKVLTSEEEYEIIRYLHLIYNIGLRLELEEMQKAQFSSDSITNAIRNKINNDFDYLNKLEELKLFNGKKKRNKIDNILLNCRLLIASTYSNIVQFSSARSIQERIEENYLPNLIGLDSQKIYQDFEFTINLIYEKLISTQKWQLYPELHTKPFIDATYWLLSVIKKDNLRDPLQFDFINYLEYFGKKEKQEQIFNSKQSHFQKNILNKYQAVAQYFEEISGKSLSLYFSDEKNTKTTIGNIRDIEELYKNHFSFSIYKIKISTLLEETKSTNYCIRPYYQREEMLNILLASKLIESILLGFVIPYLLLYDKYENGKIVTEVVDGQQRILSLLALFLSPFCNSKGELEYSKKNGYALKGLKILTELNGKKVNAQEVKNKLTENIIQKILNTELYVSKTTDEKNLNFSAVDHFVRLNKNAFTIKDNTYRMWSLIADKAILDCEKSITEQYQNSILPKVN